MVGTGDVVTVTFSETVMSQATAMGFPDDAPLVTLRDTDGDTFRVRCGLPATAVASDGITEATCTFPGGGNSGTSVTVTLLEDAEVVTAAGDDIAEYPATIIAIVNVQDDDGNDVDLANSSDLLVEQAA